MILLLLNLLSAGSFVLAFYFFLSYLQSLRTDNDQLIIQKKRSAVACLAIGLVLPKLWALFAYVNVISVP